MKRILKFVLILLVTSIALISISCKSNNSTDVKTETISSVSETKEETFLTYSGEEFPKPVGYINDYSNIIEQNYEDKILNDINKVKDDTHADVVVIIIDSLNSKNIDDYTLELFNTWQVSRYGIILLVSMADRKIRITTGYDMENVITDDMAKSIIDDVIVPKFKEGNFNEGIYQAVKKISEYILDYGAFNTEDREQ